MKRIFIYSIVFLARHLCCAQDPQLPKDSFYLLTPVEVKAVRAADNAPFAKTNLSRADIARNNLGQDLPFVLNQTPSVIVNSDAGNGVGYTGIRIRGTDASRINITLNGIPFNDPESQGTFFVDIPDFVSSAGSIQVQRGVGTSSNGAGAYGGSINISTNEVIKNPYAELNNSYGSFQTWKNTVKAGTGLMGDRITSDITLSHISSDGYIDRAFSKLKSLHYSLAYINKNTSLRFNLFSGREKTYQAWYGITEADLVAGNRTVNYAGTEKPGDPYKNETDNYEQTHYQLFFNHSFSSKFSFNTALFAVDGKGYYEEYRANQAYADYGLKEPPSSGTPITNSDMIRRLYLDNHFYGDIFSGQYRSQKISITLGGGYSQYNGLHYGRVIWADEGLSDLKNWYDVGAVKKDLTLYLKQETNIATGWYYFYDLQYRNVPYTINGFQNNPAIYVKKNYVFFNPKTGITYRKNGWRAFLSFAVANKEPNRDDFEANAAQQPKQERLYDTELEAGKTTARYNWSTTLYYMDYKDQLVLTGKINDVGAYTRTNIPVSYRAGVELQGAYIFNKWFNAGGNIALSRNKIKNFTEYIDDYDNGGQRTVQYSSTDIALSPSIVGATALNFIPMKNFQCSFLSKYVSKQYLDNTQHNDRMLKAFYVQDIKAAYTLYPRKLKQLDLVFQLNNLFNRKYEPSGYTYNYYSGGMLSVNNYYYPMAGINFMAAVNIKL